MPTSTENSGIPPINITPFVDVLLILVVVLLLAVPLSVKKLPVELPKTELSGNMLPIKALPIAIQKTGALLVGDASSTLSATLGLVDNTTTIELSIDKDTSYETMSQVLAKLQEKNPKEIILLTR